MIADMIEGRNALGLKGVTDLAETKTSSNYAVPETEPRNDGREDKILFSGPM